MTAADGKLFVSAIDEHTVYALDDNSGDKIWSYVTGGRVDSPPTIYKGRVIFGCADGWVYCLRSSDGVLVWRYRTAPGYDKLVSYQQVESVWPLYGSILVYDGIAYCLAGRNMFVDGGMRLVRLDAMTGQLLSETVLDDKDPRTGKNLQALMAGKAVPVTNPDIFSCDGEYVYMRTQKFGLDGKRVDMDVEVGKQNIQYGEGRHLFCPTGFLDDYWFHRSYWIYGKNAGEGHGEYVGPIGKTQTGRLIVFDKSRVFSFFAHNVGNNINPRTYYSLYASNKEIPPPKRVIQEKVDRRGRKSRTKVLQTKIKQLWELTKPDLLANAMVLAGDKLFMAGPPDVADEEKTHDYVFGANDDINRQMNRQEQAWQGKQGALLWVVSADTGTKLTEIKIPAIPVWDGMIAANDKLYLSLKNGNVLCMGKRK
jgi:outer membrane protein assembly factor BamB